MTEIYRESCLTEFILLQSGVSKELFYQRVSLN